MSRLYSISAVQLISAAVLLGYITGCQPQQPFYLTGKGQYQKQMITKATQIEYSSVDLPSSPEVCYAKAPLTLDNPNPEHFWDLTLEEAVQIALKNSRVIRTLNGVNFSKGGVSGIPGSLLSAPHSIGSVYDPALAESDPRYGIEAALSAFDGQLQAGANWVKSDLPPQMSSLRSRYSGNSWSSLDDYGELTVGINKTMATGGNTYVNYGAMYSDVDYGFPMSRWDNYFEAGFTHPLLQGNGIQFNRIAGPGATPGFYNGVAIARINTDTALNDFEMAARNLVADVEKAYWNLYYAYHYLESVKSGRDSAHQTWSQTYAMYKHGATGGRAQYEAQARTNYFTFRGQTEIAQSNLFKTESVLRYILGLSATDGRLVRPTDEPIIAPLRMDWQSVMCEALVRSPELRKQKWDVKSKELQLIASKNFLMPRLDFNAGYVWSGSGHDWINSRHHEGGSAFGSMTDGNYAGWVMGLNASMPFGWRKELAAVRNAQLGLARSRAVLQEQELELTHQLTESFREISETYQQSKTMLQKRIAADAEVSSVDAAYKAGTTTLDQLLEAQKRKADAETDYYRSIIDYNLAIMTLHYRKGSLLEYNNVCLTEGVWPGKAYFDAKRRARHRDAGHYMNYGFTRPKEVSRGTYQQFQSGYYTSLGSEVGQPQYGEPLPVQPQGGEPTVAPPQPDAPAVLPKSIETTLSPSSSGIVPASASSVRVFKPVSDARYTVPSESNSMPLVAPPTPAMPVRNNRYVNGY
ncbi:MAG: TolC family protein [Planctomycetaceae bacterium]|nr:TolC family protein [Planctomycetaceae bacterium]